MTTRVSLLFVCLQDPTVRALSDAFADLPDVTCEHRDVRNVPLQPGTMFMSPSNSIGFMDGGIDAAYMTMFEGIQNVVQAKIKTLDKRTALGRFYLPVGSAVVVPVKNRCCLVSAPTMFLPHDVSGTRNAYYAMMAALMAYRKQGSRVRLLVATGLCCGYGKMSPVVSARQMREAYDDFVAGRVPLEVEREDDPTYVITENRDHEQPDNYDNRELREMTVKTIDLHM